MREFGQAVALIFGWAIFMFALGVAAHGTIWLVLAGWNVIEP